MNDLLIMKFGGTSVGCAERIRVAARLAAQGAARRPVVVVVSAMSKITDLLLDTLRQAGAGDRAGMQTNLAALRARHGQACRELLPETRREAVLARLDELVNEFERIASGAGMPGALPQRSVDEALAIGERLSVELVSEHLNAIGTPAVAVNARDVVVTDEVFGNAAPIMPATRQRALERMLPILERGAIPVVTGFNGATADGRPTTLGRGGSDFSASILAAALDASELWIWSDVDGILSADPKLVPHAQLLPEVTYAEATELACNGAKVLHPRTLVPLVEKKIPVWCRNSFAPDKPGTRIVPEIAGAGGILAVASIANVVLVSIAPASVELTGARVTERALDAIAGVNVELLPLTASRHRHFRFLVRSEELGSVARALELALEPELAHGRLRPIRVDHDVALVAAVGKGTQGKPALASRIFAAISRVQVNIIALARGSSELTIAVVVERGGLERAVRAVHAECRLGPRVASPAGAFSGSVRRLPKGRRRAL